LGRRKKQRRKKPNPTSARRSPGLIPAAARLPSAGSAVHAVRPQDWTIAPALGWCALAFAAVLLVREGSLGAITRLLTEAPTAPPTTAGPTFATADPHAAASDVAPALPPKPDLAPLPRQPGGGGGAPESTPGKTVEDVCVEPLGATTGCRRWAMDGFYGSLVTAEGGKSTRPARVSFYGDSVSATDALPGRLRARLQDVFGDGGPGFVHAIQPHKFNHSEAVDRRSSGSWRSWNITTTNIADHLYGVGNATTQGAGSIRMAPKTPSKNISRAEVYYLAQPGGGTAELKVGDATATIDTASPAKAARFQAVTVADGAHVFEMSARGKVRLFGVSLERDAGIVVDNMALVSCTAKTMLENLTDHWKNQLAHREADLIVIMLGTNEAQWLAGASAMAEYEKTWSQLLAPVRAARPQASCLVMSPLDQAETKDDKIVSRRGVPKMVAAQRKAAQAAGCAYWDTFTWMGGSGAAITWRRKGLLGSDFAHMSRKGTAKVADGLADALFTGYKAYKGR
jgi:lysophospholipase L1-like esterase